MCYDKYYSVTKVMIFMLVQKKDGITIYITAPSSLNKSCISANLQATNPDEKSLLNMSLPLEDIWKNLISHMKNMYQLSENSVQNYQAFEQV